jgi:2,4-dienoyl-CoA reductase-like NADH-dependent reductase (Old Yellow Enzyme family)
VPGEDVAAYYACRAESLGIVMTEVSYGNESAGGFDNVPRLFGDDALTAWAGRVRLSAEIAAAVRAAVGPEFPVDFRFAQWKGNDFDARIAESPKELEAFLTPLVEAGVSMFHASTRRYWLPAFDGSGRTLASLSLAPLADLVNRGEFDLVAMGRACLADPHWAVKVSSGRLSEIRPYNKSADAFLY